MSKTKRATPSKTKGMKTTPARNLVMAADADDPMPDFGAPGDLLADPAVPAPSPAGLAPEAKQLPAQDSDSGTAPKVGRPRERRATPVSPTCLAAVCAKYLASLVDRGKSAGTARSYGADVAILLRALGRETEIATLTETQVAAYFDSDAVTKRRDGSPKDPVSVAKIRRIAKQVLEFAEEKRLVDVAPLPPKTDTAA